MFGSRVKTKQSAKLFERAQKVLPGGVNSPVRAFKAVGGTPRFISHAAGARIEDVDGNRYIDYVMSWGPLIHGHAPRELVKALAAVAKDGTSFGAPTELEVAHRRARAQADAVDRDGTLHQLGHRGDDERAPGGAGRNPARSRDQVRRAAITDTPTAFLVDAGSGALTLGVPTSPGVAAETAALTLTAAFNDIASVDRLFAANPRPDRRSHRRARRRQHGRRRRPSPASSKACVAHAMRTARCWCSTR